MSQLGLKSLLVLMMVSISVINLQAQDRIIKTNQTVLTVKIYEIGEETLRYKPWDRQEGPIPIMIQIYLRIWCYQLP